MKILVIRFRQMGDAILATPLLSTLRARYPDAQIDFVLNARIAPLFEGHPAISRIITFTDDERHSLFAYLKKVWRTVHQTRYDAIIDMRSTVNTMLFALFSLRSKWRIGIRKPYTWGIFNHRFEGCEANESMIDHNLKLSQPLPHSQGEATEDRNLSLCITENEKHDFRQYMEHQGIDFQRPVMLVGVTAKLADKTWPEDRMTETLRRLMAAYPDLQLIFNYAPGQEEENARRIYDKLCTSPITHHPSPRSSSARLLPTGRKNTQKPTPTTHHPSPNTHHPTIFLNISACSPRELAAMAANCTAYFGNEGGARHIVQAMGRPSMVVCSPGASKTTWLPQDTAILTVGIAASDIADTDGMSRQQQYDLISVDRVWPMLDEFCKRIASQQSSSKG